MKLLGALSIVGLLTSVCVGQSISPAARRVVRAGNPQNSNIPEIVKKALKAQRYLRFQGRRVVTIRREGVNSSFEDLVWQDGKSTRVEYPPGSTRAGQIIVDANGERRHYFPSEGEIEIARSKGSGLPSGNVGALSRRAGARFVIGGTEMIAGVGCQVVEAEGPNGAGLRLWIDPVSGMVLRRETYDLSGNLVAGFEFTQIEIGASMSPATFTLDVPNARIVTSNERIERIGRKHGFEPLRLPESSPFNLDGGRVMKTAGREAFVQMYSGPGGRFSLFRVRGEVDPQELQRKAKGFRSLTWTRNGETLALVGDVDESTLRTVAEEFGKP